MKPQTSYDAVMEQEAKANRRQIEALWAQQARDRQYRGPHVTGTVLRKLFFWGVLAVLFVAGVMWWRQS